MYKYSLEDNRPIAEDGKGQMFGMEVPQWVEIGGSFVPFLGSAMDIYNAYKDPSLGNIGNAILSTGLDIFGAGAARSLYKGYKAAKAARTTAKTLEKKIQVDKLGRDILTKQYKNTKFPNSDVEREAYEGLRQAKQRIIHNEFKLNQLNRQSLKYPNSRLMFELYKQGSLLPITVTNAGINLIDYLQNHPKDNKK